MTPAVLDQLLDRVRGARAQQAHLDIRGGGTKSFYKGRPQGEPLDVRGLRGISAYEPSELVVTVRAGTPLAELEDALAQRQQGLAFEPPRLAAGGTVGGMVACGLSGPARPWAGSVRDYVLGLTMINGKGQLLSFGGQVMKNVAGYDVSRLMVGSHGILGVICDVSLKVMPLPTATRTLCFEMDERVAIETVNRWCGRPLPLSASAWLEGMLFVRLSGAEAAVRTATRALGGSAVDAVEAMSFWSSLRDQSHPYFARGRRPDASLWRLSLPSTTVPLGLQGDKLVEWAGAQRWLVTSAPAEQVRAIAQGAGGHATLLRGVHASGTVFTPLTGAAARLHQALKQAFDPDRVFNRDRLYPDL